MMTDAQKRTVSNKHFEKYDRVARKIGIDELLHE